MHDETVLIMCFLYYMGGSNNIPRSFAVLLQSSTKVLGVLGSDNWNMR